MRTLLETARGEREADLVVRGARIAQLFSGEWETADVAVSEGRIAGVGRGWRGAVEIDAEGCLLVPGLIDGHCHLESTMLTPRRFAEALLPRGTTTVIADPHEIANVWGDAGVRYLRDAARELPLDVRFMAPSCVPASGFETCREPLDAAALRRLLDDGVCHGLGEVMNYPGVIDGDIELWRKLDAFDGYVKDGHAPGLSGGNLCAYLQSGASSDHECTTRSEALEKMRRGMRIMIREGATEHNLEELLPLVLEDTSRSWRAMFVTDDLATGHLCGRGHLDAVLRLAVDRGCDPLVALRMATAVPAEHFGLRDRGAIAPGLRADFVLMSDERSWRAEAVFVEGKCVARGGTPLFGTGTAQFFSAPAPKSVRIPRVADLSVRPGMGLLRVIGVVPGQVVTRTVELEPRIVDGTVVADTERGLSKVVVVDRNAESGRFAVGFVVGIGPMSGALASSVAHDAHNYLAVGADDRSIVTALRRLHEMGGGLVVAEGDRIAGELPLPIAGLLSDDAPTEVASRLDAMEKEATVRGVLVPHPFMVMSFLSLSVIPELKITDRGYVDLSRGGAVPLFTD